MDQTRTFVVIDKRLFHFSSEGYANNAELPYLPKGVVAFLPWTTQHLRKRRNQ
jgi:hypothetical protein